MNELNTLQLILVWAPPVLFAITLHEVAHGWVARFYGDHTAASLGRLSLNPLKHVDPMGTVVVPIAGLVLTGFVFGWAKPVPVVTQNLKRPRADMAKVAIAGPLANLVMALFWALFFRLGILAGQEGFGEAMIYMGAAGVIINLILMVLNLFPIPPLDGSRVLNGFLPESLARKVDYLERFGLIILMLLLFSGILGKLLWPLLHIMQDVVLSLVGLSGSGITFF